MMASFFLDPGRFDVYRFYTIKGEGYFHKNFFPPWMMDWSAYFRNISTPVLIFLGLAFADQPYDNSGFPPLSFHIWAQILICGFISR